MNYQEMYGQSRVQQGSDEFGAGQGHLISNERQNNQSASLQPRKLKGSTVSRWSNTPTSTASSLAWSSSSPNHASDSTGFIDATSLKRQQSISPKFQDASDRLSSSSTPSSRTDLVLRPHQAAAAAAARSLSADSPVFHPRSSNMNEQYVLQAPPSPTASTSGWIGEDELAALGVPRTSLQNATRRVTSSVTPVSPMVVSSRSEIHPSSNPPSNRSVAVASTSDKEILTYLSAQSGEHKDQECNQWEEEQEKQKEEEGEGDKEKDPWSGWQPTSTSQTGEEAWKRRMQAARSGQSVVSGVTSENARTISYGPQGSVQEKRKEQGQIDRSHAVSAATHPHPSPSSPAANAFPQAKEAGDWSSWQPSSVTGQQAYQRRAALGKGAPIFSGSPAPSASTAPTHAQAGSPVLTQYAGQPWAARSLQAPPPEIWQIKEDKHSSSSQVAGTPVTSSKFGKFIKTPDLPDDFSRLGVDSPVRLSASTPQQSSMREEDRLASGDAGSFSQSSTEEGNNKDRLIDVGGCSAIQAVQNVQQIRSMPANLLDDEPDGAISQLNTSMLTPRQIQTAMPTLRTSTATPRSPSSSSSDSFHSVQDTPVLGFSPDSPTSPAPQTPAIHSPASQLNTLSPTPSPSPQSLKERLEKALQVTGIADERRNEVLQLLADLPKKDVRMCLFNSTFLEKKAREAIEYLECDSDE